MADTTAAELRTVRVVGIDTVIACHDTLEQTLVAPSPFPLSEPEPLPE
ncbi:hypothetical protein ACIQI8_42205 [Streptomyces sp. NPDC092369]